MFENFINFVEQYITLGVLLKQDIINCCEKRKYPVNRIIYEEGTAEIYFLFIEKGLLRSYYYDENDNENTFDVYSENCYYYPDNTNRKTDFGHEYIDTIEETVIIKIPWLKLEYLAQNYPTFQFFLRKLNQKTILSYQNKTKLLRIKSLSNRLNQFSLLHPELRNRFPLKFVASYLNLDSSTLSRLRKLKTTKQY